MFDGKTLTVMQKAWFDTIKIYTSAGPLLLRRTPAWIFGDDAEPLTMMLSRPVMELLGYSVDAILAKAYGTRPEWDLQDTATEKKAGPLEADEMVTRLLKERVQEAADAGLAEPLVTQLRELLIKYRDVFRVSFGQDPPIRVEPLRVRVRDGATPVRISARRYPPAHMQYLDQHVDELLASGLVYTNPSSRWASPPRIVAKQEPGTYRMTVDTRAVNERTDPIQWPMPELESALGLLEKSTCYVTLDWFRGYWQLPLHRDSQEMFSIMTHRGIITPTRVLMGGTDAVAYCQHVVEEVFRPLLYQSVLAWLDDILGYALDPVNMLEVLERVLAACKSFGLKLHPGKCHFYLQEARWCGKIVSKEGIRHCPSRIQGLVAMPDPINAGQLQQFTCAVNWMRQNIPQYTQMVSPLLAVIDAAAKIAGGRKPKQLSRVYIAAVGWNQEHVDALRAIRQDLCDMVPLAHPDASKVVCLYCDASQDFWGAICTGVDQSNLSKPLSQQNHSPLAFLSGKFTPAQSRWPTIEKEAFAIVESAKRLEYLLLRPGGFHHFTDHRNLVNMFDPFATDTAMPRYRADKLQRWAMTMTSYNRRSHFAVAKDATKDATKDAVQAR
ncbi:Retrotransposon protein, Ty3-gypsy subclass [Phytophthora cinnamomi]|uniref:Retrotransposon protein, Ty3-gypsy subclass n=1 Tax=Phytophthora cinnamomi TaxID=4785 RepID=UPI003559CBD7|nr:Retrotransposon protein, Ty3-gypsy subclass [Phytophthora cinnamomi]